VSAVGVVVVRRGHFVNGCREVLEEEVQALISMYLVSGNCL
jgi:hypothetical protein